VEWQNLRWEKLEAVDFSPKQKREIEFTDYKCGDFLISDYVDCFHVFHQKKYVTRVRTLRMAKQVVRWMSGEPLPKYRRRITVRLSA
jgi:hypothetical protein